MYIDRNYTKYREKYKKWFKNDKVYQSLDYSSPEYADDILAVSSEILEDGTRCDILQNGYWMERFSMCYSNRGPSIFYRSDKNKKEIKFTVKMTGYSFMDGLSFFCINLLINSDMLFLK